MTDAHGNRPDTCGHCTLLPAVNGWTRATQTRCPVHGDPPRRYGWLPCLACGSDRHYLDDCDNAEALAAYYADEDD